MRGSQQIECRLAQIAADTYLDASSSCHPADECRNRAFTVRSRDTDHRRVYDTGEHFDVADDLKSPCARIGEEGLCKRYTRRCDNTHGIVEQPGVETTEPQRNVWK